MLFFLLCCVLFFVLLCVVLLCVVLLFCCFVLLLCCALWLLLLLFLHCVLPAAAAAAAATVVAVLSKQLLQNSPIGARAFIFMSCFCIRPHPYLSASLGHKRTKEASSKDCEHSSMSTLEHVPSETQNTDKKRNLTKANWYVQLVLSKSVSRRLG